MGSLERLTEKGGAAGAVVIVVDTSVWIDFLNENDSAEADLCTALIEKGAPVALTDTVLTEAMNGARS